jgi:hypothetical protein
VKLLVKSGRKEIDQEKTSENDLKYGKNVGTIQGNTNQCPSPVESPISVVGKSPCGQVNIPLDSRPLYQDRKVKMDTNIPLNLTN